jgi:hypothetical protein
VRVFTSAITELAWVTLLLPGTVQTVQNVQNGVYSHLDNPRWPLSYSPAPSKPSKLSNGSDIGSYGNTLRLPGLPGKADDTKPVTVDLIDRVNVRARTADQHTADPPFE